MGVKTERFHSRIGHRERPVHESTWSVWSLDTLETFPMNAGAAGHGNQTRWRQFWQHPMGSTVLQGAPPQQLCSGDLLLACELLHGAIGQEQREASEPLAPPLQHTLLSRRRGSPVRGEVDPAARGLPHTGSRAHRAARVCGHDCVGTTAWARAARGGAPSTCLRCPRWTPGCR